MKWKVLTVITCIFIISIVSSFCLAETVKLQIPSGTKIQYDYYKSTVSGKRPVVLLLPGLSGLRDRSLTWNITRFAKGINEKYDFNVLVVDYRGKTNEEMLRIVMKEGGSITLVEQEVATALDYLRKQENVDGEKIGVVGFSLGTVVAIRTAAREDCVKVMGLVSLITGPDEDDETFKSDFSRCANRPILFVAAKDDYMPQNKTNAAKNSLYWSQQAKGITKVEIVNGSKHSAELLEIGDIREMIGEWFKANLLEK